MIRKRIKILHIQQSVSFGGVERRRLSLGKHLNKDIFQQKLICTSHRGELIEEIRTSGVEVFEIGNLKSPFHWSQHKKVQKIIDEYKPDIVHGAVFEGVTMAAVNGWLKNVPVVIIEETSDPQNRSWKGHLLMKIFAKISDKVIGVSQSVTEEYLKGKLNLTGAKVVCVDNGVALPREIIEREIEESRVNWGISDEDFIVGTTGRMLHDSHKRFSDLIRAFAIFSNGKENVKLLLIGDGPEKPGYEKLAIDLGITDKIIFTGYQSDVSLFYQLMDIFSLVSSREAFGLVLAEAMLSKLPVIATRVGGMKYIVDDGETGYLVEPYNVDGIVEKLEILFQDRNLSKKLGENGLKKALLHFTEKGYTKKIERLYLELIKKYNEIN